MAADRVSRLYKATMHTSLGSQCQHKEWAECEIIRDNPPLNWASIGRWQPLSRELGGKHSSPVAESVSRSARWSWAIAGEWDDKSWQWRNNNNTADHHSHHLILQIWAYDSHQAIIIIIASLSSSSWQHRTLSSCLSFVYNPSKLLQTINWHDIPPTGASPSR